MPPVPRPAAAALGTLILTLLLRTGGVAAEVPYLTGRVNDIPGVLSSQTVLELETLLKAHEDSTSNQVVVLIVSGLEGEPLEEYSLRVAQSWRLGRKGTDNGVLLLIARDDRKVRIEVGTGLEGALPDILCGQIIRNEIIPRFRANDYDGGVRRGVDAILAAIKGEYVASSDGPANQPIVFSLVSGLLFIVVVGTFTAIALLGEGCFSWFLYLFLVPFWFGFPVAILGKQPGLIVLGTYVVGFLLLKYWMGYVPAGKEWRKSLGGTPFFGGMVGSRGGAGTFGGGSHSGGGFSGGGGGFSGGGASGSW